jgi:hypothetical protein
VSFPSSVAADAVVAGLYGVTVRDGRPAHPETELK